MNRRKFIKNLAGIPVLFTAIPAFSQNLINDTNMKKVIHRANTRGHANHGWLNSFHTFSFAGYHNPDRMRFGLLRVLNDDTVAPGEGFGTHPHDNMEIISIALKGSLEHKDSMGNKTVIKPNEVQIMSAGTGVRHSEYNHSKDEEVKFLQIWVFPKEENITPKYEQKYYAPEEKKNKLKLVVSPDHTDGSITINQDAYFSLGDLDNGTTVNYKINKSGNGVYLFVLEGAVEVDGETLNTRDGMGISETDSFNVKATANTQLLLMEVPMN